MTKLAELAQQTHEAELKRKEELTSALTFPAGLLTALAAALASMLVTLRMPFDLPEMIMIGLAAGAFGTGIYSVYYLIKARLAHTYFYPADISQVRDWYESVLATGRTSAEADDLLERYLFEEHVKCASQNSNNNDLRSAQIFKANQGLIWLLILTVATGVPFIWVKIASEPLSGDVPQSISVCVDCRGATDDRSSARTAKRNGPARAGAPAPADARDQRKL